MPSATPSLVRWVSCSCGAETPGLLQGKFRAFALRQKLGETKIEELYLTAIGNENVRGLDVAVNDGLGVCGFEGIGHLVAIFRDALDFHGFSGNEVLEGVAFQVFHDDETLAFILIHVIDRADMRMIQGGGGPRFALEAFDGQRLFGKKSSGRNFRDTWRPSLRSSALYTTPMPPPPSFSRMR